MSGGEKFVTELVKISARSLTLDSRARLELPLKNWERIEAQSSPVQSKRANGAPDAFLVRKLRR
jgi:hypothetical protein